MVSLLRRCCFLVVLLSGLAAQADTVAVTEFFNQPIGELGGRQWVELFNYGNEPVSLRGWRMLMGGNSIIDLEPLSIQPGDYMIVVCTFNGLPRSQLKQVFETEWLGGRSEPRVMVVPQGRPHLGTTGGEITLQNRRRQTVWQLFYRNDGQPGRSTFFADSRFRLVTRFGKAGQPGVNRKGNDADVTGGDFLGYEGNQYTKDEFAFESDVSGLQTGFDDLYGPQAPNGQAQPGHGSPLLGPYKHLGAK